MGLGIICVDDEKIVVDSLRSLLTSYLDKEYILEFAESGEEVFEIIEEFKKENIDLSLIITDYIMPKLKGDELLIEVQKVYPKCKKIMLTGQADLSGIEKVINNANLYRFITKPWNNEDLILTINEALKSYKNEAEIRKNTEILKKTVEEKTKELKKYLHILNENVMVLKIDEEGSILDASEAFLRFIGMEKNLLLSKNYKELIPNSYDYAAIFSSLKKDGKWKGEVQLEGKDDKVYWMDSTFTKTDEKGKIIYNIIKHDITDKKKIEELIIKDPMTGLYNRRFFNDIFPLEIKRARREEKHISFIILDVDHFKLYNDNYGHQMGDDVLIQISKIMKNMCQRPSDYPLRLGGEEFGVIFYGQDQYDSINYAKLIKDEIEKLNIEHLYNGHKKIVTASFGVISVVPNDNVDMDIIYNCADTALYNAKSSGRDMVILGECDF